LRIFSSSGPANTGRRKSRCEYGASMRSWPVSLRPLLEQVHALQLHPQPVLRPPPTAPAGAPSSAGCTGSRPARSEPRRTATPACRRHRGCRGARRRRRWRRTPGPARRGNTTPSVVSALPSSAMRASIAGAARAAAPATGSGAWPARAAPSTGTRQLPAVRRRRAAARVRPLLVIEDRVRPVEAVAGEALLVAQPPPASAQRRVVLRGTLADHAVEHRRPHSRRARRVPCAAARARCSRTARGSCRRRSPGRPCAG
jgi:hypothetical protein